MSGNYPILKIRSDEATRSGRQVDLSGLPCITPCHPEHGGAVILHDAAPCISGDEAPAVANAHAESGIQKSSSFEQYLTKISRVAERCPYANFVI